MDSIEKGVKHLLTVLPELVLPILRVILCYTLFDLCVYVCVLILFSAETIVSL